MIYKTPILFLTGLWMVTASAVFAQTACDNTYAKILGSLIDNEKGYSLAAWPAENVLYLGGLKNDSVAILKINAGGEIEWTRTFNFVAGQEDHIKGFIVDSEGMIVGSGGTEVPNQGTSVFAFRYNPQTNSMLWAREFRSAFNNIGHSIQEIYPGGDYLMSNNPHTTTPNDLELIRLDRMTGQVVPSFSKHYHLGGSDNIGDFMYHNGFLYGAGRFTDGQPNAKMRITLFKIDPDTGQPVWTLLGHKPQSATARLYGVDLVIHEDTLYSIAVGDPDGTDINTTEVFIQKHTLDGELIWMNRYDLPGTNDWVDEIISIDDGLIIFGHHRVPPSDLYLFKIDRKGAIAWSKKFDFSDNDNVVNIGSLQSQMLKLENHIYFTAHTLNNGSTDMVLVKTDLQGHVSDTCFGTSDVTIPVIPVINPVYYTVQVNVMDFMPQVSSLPVVAGSASNIQTTVICSKTDSVSAVIDAVICEGGEEEGYTQTGQYIDHFMTAGGCDSMRVLNLLVHPLPQTTIEKEICTGQTHEGYAATGVYVDTFISVTGCDSIRILQLEVVDEIVTALAVDICPGQVYEGYTDEGIYTDTLPSSFGCDSIRILTLYVVLPEKETRIGICSGMSYQGYTQAGMYIDTLPGPGGGCDTVRYLELIVSPPIESSYTVDLCEGDSYFGYMTDGLYTDSLSTPDGCDSIRTVEIRVIPPSVSLIQASFCEGISHGYTRPGTYVDTLLSYTGCDSIRTLYLEGLSRYIPNVFSPNDDQVNDVFEIFTFPEEGMDLLYFAIFDRFGDMVYETSAWPVRWDGRHASTGRYFNPGVFTYVIISNCHGKEKADYGNITLVR